MQRKKETLAQVFPCEFCEISQKFFLQNTSGGCFYFMAIEFFIFQVEAFQFSKLYEKVDKPDNRNFKRVLTMTLKVENLQIFEKKWLKIM